MVNLLNFYKKKLLIILKLFLDNIILYRERRFLKIVYNTYIENNIRVEHILKLKPDGLIGSLIRERDIPSNEKWLKSGWYRIMLLRYGIAMYFSKKKNVLETCSGIGWGAYLLSGVANIVRCIEIDKKTIDISKRLWNVENVKYICSSVLKMPIQNNTYDIVTAMESIEHFKLEDIKIYLKEIYRTLKKGGLLIISSSFPSTIEKAKTMCLKNKYHLYICTAKEIKRLLVNQGFRKIKIFRNRLFVIAKK